MICSLPKFCTNLTAKLKRVYREKRQQAETDAQEVPPDHGEQLLYCAGDCALEEVPQTVQPPSLHPEPSGCNPVQHAVGRPCPEQRGWTR